jgi:tetratricopeptide (TPR) repeat protein
LRPFQREEYGWLPDTRAFACRRFAAETRTPTMDAAGGSPWIDGISAATTPDCPAKGRFDMAEPPRALHRPARKAEALRLPEEMAPPGELSPGSLEPKEGGLFEAARRKADRGELEDALALCRRFLDTRPTDIPAHFLKGMIHQALGDDGEAERWLDRTIYLDPDHLAAMDLLGIIAEQRGDIDRADRLRRRADRIRHRREA